MLPLSCMRAQLCAPPHHTHTQWNTIQPLKKKEILLSGTTWMNKEDITLNGLNQTEKDKFICKI